MKFDLSKEAQAKIVYIMRGISGSGKSTLANQLGQGGSVFSSDDFFMVNDEYQFDADYLSDAHSWNKGRAVDAMAQGISPIVIDNTHTQPWEAKPYVMAAQKYGYQIEIREAETPWKFDAEELTRRNSHGVPRNVIDDMLDRWHPDMTVDDIVNSEKPKTASSRMRLLFAAGLDESIQNLGLAPDVAQYIMSVPDKAQQGQLFNYVRQNPGLTVVDLQQWQPPQKNNIDPYIQPDRQMAAKFPPIAQQWVLVNLKNLRNDVLELPIRPGVSDPNFPEFEAYNIGYNTLSELARTNGLTDYLNAYPSVNIDGMTIDEVNDDVEEWHEVMAGRGAGKLFGPTVAESIVYGPNNWSNKEWSGWTVQLVTSKNDLEVEGNQVGHCVGSYCDDVEDQKLRIFSLRDPSNTPYVTIETEPDSYTFKQIFGNGPKTGNAEPDPVYKKMLGEWMQTLDGAIINTEEENESYNDLQHGYVGPAEVYEKLNEAIDWDPISEYGIPTASTDDTLYSVEDLYDVSVNCLESKNNYHNSGLSYANDVGDTLAEYALDKDIMRMKDDGALSEQAIRMSAAKGIAYDEFRNKFMSAEYDKRYSNGVHWSFTNPESEAESKKLTEPFEDRSLGYHSDYHARDRYYESRAAEIIEASLSDQSLDQDLHKRMITKFEEESFVGQLMELRQSHDEKFFESYDSYNDGNPYPDEDDYEDDDEGYNSAMAAYEESESYAVDYARKEDLNSVLFDGSYDSFMKSFGNYEIGLPSWLGKYPSSGGSISLQWLKHSAKSKMEE